ncbi:MAG: RICIN domain-containing protein [Candidatus Azobacteroides sp.]|nr:RICIN domain-containing protein [Candidatus Azobacteroides sp.]
MKKSSIFCILFSFLLNFSFLYPQELVTSWQTNASQAKLFLEQPEVQFQEGTGSNSIKININGDNFYQVIEGFGWTLTQGSAYMIRQLPETEQDKVLSELFSVENGLGSATLRVAIGASDLSTSAYTYQDNRNSEFSLAGPDLDDLIPVLKKIVAINPDIKIMGSPWSAPAWMKTSSSLQGGYLRPERYADYADYFLRYFQAMREQGIEIYSVTVQNEPENGSNTPSMLMTAQQQVDFVNNHLGPKLADSEFNHIKIIAYDHNCDNTDYPIYVCNNSPFVDGSAFHLYSGDISALTETYYATGKNVYFTEQWVGGGSSFSGDFGWHMENIMIGAVNNWAKISLEWNIASDQNWNPHTNGGCDNCMGALTIHNQTKEITRNVAYYVVAHMSKVSKDGAYRIESVSTDNDLIKVAFFNSDNTLSLVIYNTSNRRKNFDVQWESKYFPYTLEANTAASFLWQAIDITTPVTGVNVKPSSITLSAGNTARLIAEVLPADATLKKVRWSVDNENIVTVNTEGEIIARRPGTALITATTIDGGFTASAVITVEACDDCVTSFPEIYEVISLYSEKGLDVKDHSMSPGGGIQQWEIGAGGSGDNQRWILDYISDNLYYIQSKYSGLYLTANGVENGATLTQQEFTGNTRQEWTVNFLEEQNGKIIYSIINSFNGKSLDVSGPSVENGTEVHLWEFLGNENQKWEIKEVEKRPTVGIKNPEDMVFKIYPNPVEDILYIEKIITSPAVLSIYSVTGQLIITYKLEDMPAVIDFSDKEPGIYVVKYQDEENSFSARIIKRKTK